MGKKVNRKLEIQMGDEGDQFVYISRTGICSFYSDAQKLMDRGVDCGIRYNAKRKRKCVSVGEKLFVTGNICDRNINLAQYKHPEDDAIIKIWYTSESYAETLGKRGYVIWEDAVWEDTSSIDSIIAAILSDSTKFPTPNNISMDMYEEMERFASELNDSPKYWHNTVANIMMAAQQSWLRAYRETESGLQCTDVNFADTLKVGYKEVRSMLANNEDPRSVKELGAVRIVFPKEADRSDIYSKLKNTRIYGFIPETGYYLINVQSQCGNTNFAYRSSEM